MAGGRRIGSLSRTLPPAGPESIETFDDTFAGGWFVMFPAAGFTGEMDGQTTHFHGEVNRLPWEVLDFGSNWIEARVETVRTPFSVFRRLILAGGELRIQTEISNPGTSAASFTYGEHPCFPLSTFAGGRIELGASDAWVPEPAFDPGRAKLLPGKHFAWPYAPSRRGVVDLSALPGDGDGRHDHVCAVLSSPLVRIGAPRYGRTLNIEIDAVATPYVLIWQYSESVACSPSSLGVPPAGVCRKPVKRMPSAS